MKEEGHNYIENVKISLLHQAEAVQCHRFFDLDLQLSITNDVIGERKLLIHAR